MLLQPFWRMSSPNIEQFEGLSKSSCRNMTNETSSEMLIAAEVARWLRLRPSTAYAWAAAGKIPCVKLNGAVRFIRADIERWITDRSSGPGDSRTSVLRPIGPPQSASVSRQTIKQAGTRAIKRVTGRPSSQRNSASRPLLPTGKVEERKDER